MENLGYRILPLWDPRLIADAIHDMEKAGRQFLFPPPLTTAHARSVSTGGKAFFGRGMLLTPVETPEDKTSPTLRP